MIKNTLISPDFLQKLEVLQIMSKKTIKGTSKGERASVKRGRSVEFADYRNYVFGDEPKIIDWNVFGRLDKLFVKLFVEEEELTLYILIDRSLSMDFGSPSKLDVAKKMAAAISYIALSNFDRASLGVVDSSFSHYQAPVRGKKSIFTIFEYLESIKAEGKTSLAQAADDFCRKKLRPGVVVILSDFLDGSDFSRSLSRIAFLKNDLFLIQILDPFEINPDIGGDLKMVDIETGAVKEITVTDKLLAMYKESLEAHCEYIRDFCHKCGAGYLLAPASVPFEDLVLDYLRAGRLIK